jgi:hypothetical protein
VSRRPFLEVFFAILVVLVSSSIPSGRAPSPIETDDIEKLLRKAG